MKKIKNKGLGMRSATYRAISKDGEYNIYKIKNGWVAKGIGDSRKDDNVYDSFREIKEQYS